MGIEFLAVVIVKWSASEVQGKAVPDFPLLDVKLNHYIISGIEALLLFAT